MDEQKSKKLYIKHQGEANNLLLKKIQIFPMKQRYRYMQYCLTKKFSTSEREKMWDKWPIIFLSSHKIKERAKSQQRVKSLEYYISVSTWKGERSSVVTPVRSVTLISPPIVSPSAITPSGTVSKLSTAPSIRISSASSWTWLNKQKNNYLFTWCIRNKCIFSLRTEIRRQCVAAITSQTGIEKTRIRWKVSRNSSF